MLTRRVNIKEVYFQSKNSNNLIYGRKQRKTNSLIILKNLNLKNNLNKSINSFAIGKCDRGGKR
jgi:hypothetical protein